MVLWQYAGVFTLAAVVFYYDLKYRRIPNAVLVPALVASLLLHAWQGGLEEVILGLKGLAAGFGLLILPYLWGWVGGGDLKFLAVLGSFGGPHYALYAFLWGAIAGGAVSLVLLARHRLLKSTLSFMWWDYLLTRRVTSRTDITFPYGICFALGGVIALWWR
ncbi:MAG TPA: hypothetical protein ENM97_02285 [Moorella mulderi]|nr:hypothetical protein [Moorella mulderi]